jgi:hypothetical protein
LVAAVSFSVSACAQSGAGAGAAKGRDTSLDGAAGATVAVSGFIVVDQFGYRPGDDKVAVVRSPQAGFDNASRYEPGSRYELRRAGDGATVFKGGLKAWKDGAVEASSGDKGWWFDFSSVHEPGRYYVFDVERNLRSPTFSVHPAVYRSVLKAAMRTFYYQRSGFAKKPPYADPCWADDAAYVGPNQDTQARDVTDRDNPSKVRDLGGGWFDAGDTAKYVTFAVQPVHQLLSAYTANPAAFTDDFGIPESGNGIPDVVDEVKWEIDWLRKMQYPDGSVALKVGPIETVSVAPPSADKAARYYIPACSSATIAAAGMFAHAAQVFGGLPGLAADAADLQSRAVAAWKNFQSLGTRQTGCDKGVVRTGNADWNAEDQAAYAVEAAIYLFAITHDPAYMDYVRAHYREMRPYRDSGWSRYQSDQGESLLYFTSIPGVDRELRDRIRADKLNDVNTADRFYGFEPGDDLYRAFLHDGQYHWGSNNPRANYGVSNLEVLTYSIPARDPASLEKRALGILHYFHGVNPLGMVYLSNMYSLGATSSANEIFHSWYQAKTKWSNALTSQCGPPPGYVPGGPNANAVRDGVPATIVPPAGQPPQKSYRDWNGNWPDSSWAITEPAIYYQAAYIRLLSAFVR